MAQSIVQSEPRRIYKKKTSRKVKKMANQSQPIEDFNLEDQESILLNQINLLDNKTSENEEIKSEEREFTRMDDEQIDS